MDVNGIVKEFVDGLGIPLVLALAAMSWVGSPGDGVELLGSSWDVEVTCNVIPSSDEEAGLSAGEESPLLLVGCRDVWSGEGETDGSTAAVLVISGVVRHDEAIPKQPLTIFFGLRCTASLRAGAYKTSALQRHNYL